MHDAPLSRRERQIMDIVYRRGRATAAEVRRDLADPPSYSAVRALLRILVDKGHLRHEQDGPRYMYLPTLSARKARSAALAQVVRTFFGGSPMQAVSALLDSSHGTLSSAELDELSALIESARRKGR